MKVHGTAPPFPCGYKCQGALPNIEISFVYSTETLSHLENIIPRSVAIGIQEAVYKLDTNEPCQKLEPLLLQTISLHDAASEAFYHGLLLCLCAMLDDRYRITSTLEVGLSHNKPLNWKLPGILIEPKASKDCSEHHLEKLTQTSLRQINQRNYAVEPHTQGVQTILKYGIAFCRKNVRICVEVA